MPSFFFGFSTAFIFHYIALFHFSYNDLQRILIFPFEILLFAFFIFIYDAPAAHANACTFPWLLHRRGYDALICSHQEPLVPEPQAPHQSAVNVPCSPYVYMLGIISKRPWEAVKVVVRAPALREPCTAPAAPASDCISAILTF